MKDLLSLLVIFIIFTTPLSAQKNLEELLSRHNTHSIPYISVEELKMASKENQIVLLDAREREEFEVSSIPGAIYVGYSNFSAESVFQKISDKTTPLVVYCSLGIRSETVSEKLKKAGFTEVRNLYGGIFEWKNNNFTVIDSRGNETERVHTYSQQWSKWLKKGIKVC